MKNPYPRTKLIGLLAATCLALACFALSPQARADSPGRLDTERNTAEVTMR